MVLHPLPVARVATLSCSHPTVARRAVVAAAVCVIAVLVVLLGPLPAAGGISTGNGGWHWQDPRPIGSTYQGGHFFNSKSGWLVSEGCILKTTNGGRTVQVKSNHNVVFQDVTFVDRKRGWAVGWPANRNTGRAIIYRTSNGGRTWIRAKVKFRGWLNAVCFADRRVGWAVGGRPGGLRSLVLRTVDGGRHWTRQTAANSWEWRDVQALTRKRAWIVGDSSAMARTTNGGRRWRAVEPGLGENFVAVEFRNRLLGWAASWGSVIKTTDGGATWTTQYSIGGGDDFITDIAFADSQHGWFVGDAGHMHATTNGGGMWAMQTSPAQHALFWVGARSANIALAAGYAGDLCRTIDGGAHWLLSTRFAAGYHDPLSDLDFVSDTTGWSVGGTVLKTVTGGSSWSAQSPGTTKWLYAVDFVDALNGWAVGGDGVIRHTVNGGSLWTGQPSWTGLDLRGVTFVDSQNGWAVGGEWDWITDTGAPVIRHTTNGGASWTAQPVPAVGPPTVLLDVAFADTLHGWAVGWTVADEGYSDGLILSTANGGATWTIQLIYDAPEGHSIGEASLHGIACASPTRAVAVGCEDNADGAHPLIFRTTDGGATWKKYRHPSSWLRTYAGLTDVTLRGSRGWAVGGNGIIARTDDRGATWRLLRSGVSGMLNGVSFVSTTRGWVAGDGAAILRTTSGGLRP